MFRNLIITIVLSLVFLGVAQAYEFPHTDKATITLGIEFNGAYDPATKVVSINPSLTVSNGSWVWYDVGFRRNGIRVNNLEADVYVTYNDGNDTQFFVNLGNVEDESVKNIRLDIRAAYEPRHITVFPVLENTVFESEKDCAGWSVANQQTNSFSWPE
jgi:hypothetical protein